jgi:hypothetical protein
LPLARAEVKWKLIFEGKEKLTGAGEMLGEWCRLKPVARVLNTGNGGRNGPSLKVAAKRLRKHL